MCFGLDLRVKRRGTEWAWQINFLTDFQSLANSFFRSNRLQNVLKCFTKRKNGHFFSETKIFFPKKLQKLPCPVYGMLELNQLAQNAAQLRHF